MTGSQAARSNHDGPLAPEQRPNVIYILLDDVGFAHLGCYGSEIDTPAMDSLAGTGLRFNNFHTTALCSPTRAALLTGRNHHTAGVGMVCEFQNGGPGYQGVMSRATGTVAEAFRAHGYSTFALGKWHLAPVEQTSYAGPYDQWPLARGFDRHYGFLGASTDQYHPDLVRGNDRILPPDQPGYHLSEDLVDQAIGYVRDLKAADPAKPFFMYLAFGAVHAPLHAPREYVEKYKGRFDEGWDVLRERTFRRQIESGIVPPDTELAPRNEGIVPWDDLSSDEQRLFCRMQEVLAGFVDHTDAQIGRLLAYLEASGLRDDTIVVLLSDNGASQEGGLIGRSELLYFADGECTVDDLIPTMEGMGSEFHHSHYPQGWSQVGNTPLKKYKQNTHGGGIRDPFIISWPRGIPARGEVRTQYHHVIDVTPTVLEMAGIDMPRVINGVEQIPLQGVSMATACADAAAPTKKKRQYFEMWGHRAIWADGWKAVATHPRNTPFKDDVWELYHLDSDFSECRDLAAEHPEKLAELIDLWWEEAEANQVLPLDDRFFGRRLSGLMERRARLPRMLRLERGATLPGLLAPGIPWLPARVEVDVDLGDGDEGVLLALGGRFAGYALFVQDGRLHFQHTYYLREPHVLSHALPPGEHQLGFSYEAMDDKGHGVVSLLIDGRVTVHREVHLYPLLTHVERLEVGSDCYTPVSDFYACPFSFTGVLRSATIWSEWASNTDVDEAFASSIMLNQ